MLSHRGHEGTTAQSLPGVPANTAERAGRRLHWSGPVCNRLFAQVREQAARDAGGVQHAWRLCSWPALTGMRAQNLDSDVKRALKECLNGDDATRRACIYRVGITAHLIPSHS